MTIILNGTTGITTPAETAVDITYTGALTGGTGVVNLGSGQVYKGATGSVGIGTASPVAKLDVATGSINLGATTSSVAWGATTTFTPSGGNPTAYYGMTFSGFVTNSISLSGYNGIAFYTGAGVEAARIDSSGNLLVGTTSLPTVSRTLGTGLRPAGIGGVSIRQASAVSDWAVNANSGSILNFYSDNGSSLVLSGQIVVNGNTASYTSVSDYRLKENVSPMSNALANVMALNPVTYTFKDGGQVSQGFIAHELQAVVPDCVTGAKDAVDAEGKPQYQGIDTSFLVATLTAAIQEQQVLITQQAAAIDALTTRLTALESK